MTVLFPSGQPGGQILLTMYTIDGKVHWHNGDVVTTSGTPGFNHSSFRGVGLSSGSHVLNITHILNGASDTKVFCLDGVRVESHPTATFDLGGVTVTMNPGRGSSSASQIGPVYGCLGGTVGLVLITVLTFLRW